MPTDPFATVRAVVAGDRELTDEGHRAAPLTLLLAAALIILREQPDVRIVDLYDEASHMLRMGSASSRLSHEVNEALQRSNSPFSRLLPPDEEAALLIGWFSRQRIAVPPELRLV